MDRLTLPLLLGEMPNPKTQRGLPLESLAPRLCEFAGLVPGKDGAYATLLENFNVGNAYDEHPWSRPLARGQTHDAILRLKPRVVVCLGRRAADVLDIPLGSWNWWRKGFVNYAWGAYGEFTSHEFLVAAIPHPSGRCRVYNDLDARERAHFTLREAQEIAERISRGERLQAALLRLRIVRESRSLSPEADPVS